MRRITHSLVVALVGLAVVSAGSVGKAPIVPVVCPALGPWEQGVEFFGDRGLSGQVVSDGDRRRWEAVVGPFTASVAGAVLAERIDFEARFSAEPVDPATGWFWSSVELADAFEIGEALIHQYAYASQPLLDHVVLLPKNQNWPGTWATAGSDRSAEMTVDVSDAGLMITVHLSARLGDECEASSGSAP